MKKEMLSSQELAVLQGIRNARFISSVFPSEVEPVSDPQYESWARKNLHAHAERELLIVLSGDGYQTFQGRTYSISPGTVMLFDSMESHQNSYPSDQPPGKHLLASFLPYGCVFTLVEVGRAGVGHPYSNLWIESFASIDLGGAIEKTLFPKVVPETPGTLLKWLSVTSVELLVASVLVEGYQPELNDNNEGFQGRVALAMARYIDDHYGRNCSLETLAHIAGYSRVYFSQLFKKHVGMTVTERVNVARRRAIKNMLARELPMKVIAKELGFAHESTLCRWRRNNGI